MYIYAHIHMIFFFLASVTLVQAFQLLGVLAALIATVYLAELFLTVIVLMVYCLTARGIGVESELHCWCLLPFIAPSFHI